VDSSAAPKFIEPDGFDGVYRGTCSLGADGTFVLRLPWDFEVVTVNLDPDALAAHNAVGVFGQLDFAGVSSNLGFSVSANVRPAQPTSWVAHVLAPTPIKRTLKLTWLLSDGTPSNASEDEPTNMVTIQ
jgi:hypothetical protein